MGDYGFRTVTGNDLSMLTGWLTQLQVSRWWPDPGQQIAKIRTRLGDPAITQLIVTDGETPIAFVQHYPARRWPAPQFAHLAHDTIGLDMFSGPSGFGHGGAWLRQLGDRLLGHASTLALDPTASNTRAVRAYRRAGFDGDVIRKDAQGDPVLVMTRRR